MPLASFHMSPETLVKFRAYKNQGTARAHAIGHKECAHATELPRPARPPPPRPSPQPRPVVPPPRPSPQPRPVVQQLISESAEDGALRKPNAETDARIDKYRLMRQSQQRDHAAHIHHCMERQFRSLLRANKGNPRAQEEIMSKWDRWRAGEYSSSDESTSSGEEDS